MKFLSKTRITTTLLDEYIKTFLGRENAYIVTLLNYRKVSQGYELYYEHPELLTLHDYMISRKFLEE